MNITETSIREKIEQHGYAVVPDVLSGQTVDELTSEIELALHRDGATRHGGHAMRHLLQFVPAVGAAAESAAVRRLAEPVMGPGCFVVRGVFFDKTGGANWKVPWHQDLTIAVVERVDVPGFTAWSSKDDVMHVQPPPAILERMLTVRLHLDDCDANNGPLQVISGSHRAGRLDASSIVDWKRRQSPETCIVSRGGALLMRPLLLHASSAANRPRHRRVVHLEFAAESLPNGLRWALS